MTQKFLKHSIVALLLLNEECLIGLRTNDQQLKDVSMVLFDSFFQLLSWISLQHCNISADLIYKLFSICICLNEVHIVNYATPCKVFTALQKLSSLKLLHFSSNDISEMETDELCIAINTNHSLEIVSLNDNHLGSSTVLIAKALQSVSTLKELNLNNNYCKCENLATEIACMITNNIYIEKLYLKDCYLYAKGVITICESLCTVFNLKIIDLRQNNINEEAAEALKLVILCNTRLEELYLGFNQLKLGSAKLTAALQTISSLKVLDLDYNGINEQVADDLAAGIKTSSSLEKLWLSGNYLGSSTVLVVNALKEISTLTELNLNDNRSRSKLLAPALSSAVEKNKLLELLSLRDNGLADNGVINIAQSLCKHSKLKALNLQSNNITEEAAEALASVVSSNNKLEEFCLGNNQLQLGVIKIATALKNISSLKVLDLIDNNIPEQAADDLSCVIIANGFVEKLLLNDNNLGSSMAVIARACCNNSHLKQFCIKNTGISETVAGDLAAVIKHNSSIEMLSISDNDLKSSGFTVIAQALKVTSSLKHLYAYAINITSDVSVELSSVIDHNVSLKGILLSDNLLGNGLLQIVECCSTLNSLKVLELSHNCISPTQVVNLASIVSKSNSIESLSLDGICLNASENLYLNVCTICYTKICNEARNSLTQEKLFVDKKVQLCCELMRMRICQISLLHYDYLNYVYKYWSVYISYQHKKKFDEIIVNNTECKNIAQGAKQKLLHKNSKAMMSSLQIIKTLKVINLENNNIDEDAATELAGHLHCNNILEQLWLRGNELYDKGALVVLQSLHNLSTLLILDLSFNHLSSESADGIAVVISNNCSLQQLWLDGNDLLTRGIVVIANALKKLSSLRILSLCSNGISDDAADEISDVITSNVLLVDLLLGNNQLQASGICKIAIALRKLLMLRRLDLFNNHINPDAAEALAVTLTNCTNLQQLFLNDNMLGTEGIIKIANALQCVNSLQVLTLSNNNITESAADVLVEVLKNNTSLKIVLIGGNNLQISGIKLIAQTAKNVTTLQLLDVSDNNVSEDEKENFKAIFASNSNFIIIV